MPRPLARQDMTGKRPFVVKKIGWKCCAAPSLGQKMYARISTADGSVYDNSYIGNTISWQKEPTVTYEFQAISLHFADDGGTKIRAWLISGGPFIHSVAGGAPVGYVYYAQTALPPTGLTVTRDTTDVNKVLVDWKKWDVKADLAAIGDTYSLSGYVVQVSNNADFSTALQPTPGDKPLKNGQVRTAYLSGKTVGEIYGLYSGYDWWFRISTRNEVSEHYKLPGGIWSEAIKLDAKPYVPVEPAGNVGTGGTESNDADGGSTGGVSGNNPGSTSNSGGTSTTSTATETVTETKEVTVSQVKAAKDTLTTTATQLAGAVTAAHAQPSPLAWASAANIAAAIAASAIVIRDQSSEPLRTKWGAIVTQAQAAGALAGAAATAAAAAQTDQQKLDAAIAQTRLSLSKIPGLSDAAVSKGTTSGWRALAEEAAIFVSDIAAVLTVGPVVLPATPRGLWSGAQTAVLALKTAAGLALLSKSAADTAAAKAASDAAIVAVTAALAVTTTPVTQYQDAETAMTALITATNALLKITPITKTVTTTTTRPIGTTTPSTSGDTTTSGATATQTSNGAPVIWTPIPDTTTTRTPLGGLLVSRSPRTPQKHTVYLMDRGGRQRIGQFNSPTKIAYNRIRDDQSTAEITLDGDSLQRNKAVIDALSVGRHELLIYRGTERVWEGPITLATWKRESVEVHAKDITHYLNRTVMKAAYSNAFPNIDFVVNRIAGIIANELGVKEALDPPVNILPFMHTFVQEGDARTTRSTLPAETTVWQHLDDLAAKAGIDYTVVGRALYVWDTSRPALGRTRIVTEQDFLGDTYISAYGMELATQAFITDGQGNYGVYGGVDDYYGEVDLISTAYDENGNAVNQEDTDPTNDTVAVEEMQEQAERNIKGRNPTPMGLHVADGSAFRLDRGLGLDVLVPGVHIPVVVKLAGRELSQMMKLKELKVSEDSTGEAASLTLTPASATGDDTLQGDGDGAA